MALIQCAECQKEVSNKALSCPNCGAPVSGISSAEAISMPIAPSLGKRPFVRPGFLLAFVLAATFFVIFGRGVTSMPIVGELLAFFREPQKVVDERVRLNERTSNIYSFRLDADSRVRVQVNAHPNAVDAMLMTQVQADKFKAVSKKLLGGKFTYQQALSSKNVLRMDKTELLPAGEWAIVVSRPSEGILFQESSTADVVVTVY